MIYIYINYTMIYFFINNEIYEFGYENIENELSYILEQLIIDKNTKVYLILENKNMDIKRYTSLLKVKHAIYLSDIFLTLKKDILIVCENYSLRIENNDIKELDIKKEDNYGMDGIEYIVIGQESIIYIFNLCIKNKIPNRLKKKLNFNIYIYILCAFMLSFSYLFTNIFYNNLDIVSQIREEQNKLNDLNSKLIEINNNINKNNEKINNIRNTNNFVSDLSKLDMYETIIKLIELSQKGVNYTKISYIDNMFEIEGVSYNYKALEDDIDEYNIEYLLNTEKGVKFKLSSKVN